MEEKRTGKVLSALKPARAKFHSGRHVRRNIGGGKSKMVPHAPHPKLTAEENKFLRGSKESLHAFAKRLGLPAPGRGEAANETKYYKRIGLNVSPIMRGRYGRSHVAKKVNERNKSIAKQLAHAGKEKVNTTKGNRESTKVYNRRIKAEQDRIKRLHAAVKYTAPKPKPKPKPALTATWNIKGNSSMAKSKAPKAKTTAQIQAEADRALVAADPRKNVAKTRENYDTPDKLIQQVAAPTDVKAQTVDAPDMAPTATVGQTAITQGVPGAEATEMTAAKVGDIGSTKAATGTVSQIAEADAPELSERAETVARDTRAEQAAKAQAQDFEISDGSYVDKVTGKVARVAPTPEAEAAQREAILGEAAKSGEAAQIVETLGYNAAQVRTVKGSAAKGAAAEMLAVVGELPPELTATIVENPVEVEGIIDEQPVEVREAVAALPTEALVSSQMETLLAGMEDGEIPAWARPALSAVEKKLAARGMSRSSVGRDALFNSIIQSAMPIAQSNAQALQQRAAQNLTNQQQANILEANLNSQRRLQNVANRQTAASQTAQNAQQMAALQSQFSQDTMIQSAAQQQQMRMQNLQNQQQAAVENVRNRQQSNLTNLGNEQQVELANLQYEYNTNAANMSATNQQRLVEMQTAAEFLSKNADLAQQMSLANLSNDQQMRLANLSALNAAGADNLNAEQQTELANLNKQMQTNITQANIASQMNVSQLNADQQRAIQNATMVANVDMSKFNAEQQVVLANSKFMQTMVQAEFSADQQAMLQNATALASMDLAAADQQTKLAITNAQNFLQMDMTNLSNKQQAIMFDQQSRHQTLLSNQSAENAARQFNAATQTDVDKFMSNLSATVKQQNAAQLNAMRQFNVTEVNRQAAIKAGNQLEAEKATAQLKADVEKFNEQVDLQRDQWNAANAQAVEQSNIAWRRQANTINTAAQNAANQQHAQNVFNLNNMELAQLWQQLRDESSYLNSSYENEQNRKTQLYATAIGNEAGGASGRTNLNTLITKINGIYK